MYSKLNWAPKIGIIPQSNRALWEGLQINSTGKFFLSLQNNRITQFRARTAWIHQLCFSKAIGTHKEPFSPSFFFAKIGTFESVHGKVVIYCDNHTICDNIATVEHKKFNEFNKYCSNNPICVYFMEKRFGFRNCSKWSSCTTQMIVHSVMFQNWYKSTIFWWEFIASLSLL